MAILTGRQNLNYIASVLEDVTKDDMENAIKSSGLVLLTPFNIRRLTA